MFIIIFCLIILSFSFPSHAEGVVLDPASTSTITEFFSMLPDFQLQSYGYDYSYDYNPKFQDIFQIFTGNGYDATLNYDFTEISNTRWEPTQNFYNPSTRELVDRENLVLVHVYNDMTEGYCVYDIRDEVICSYGDDPTHAKLSLYGYGTDYFNETVEQLNSFVDEYGYCAWFNPNTVSTQTLEYLDSYGGSSNWGIWDDPNQHIDVGWFVPDVNATNLFYVTNSYGGTLIHMTAEGYALFSYWNNSTRSDIRNGYVVVNEPYTVNGVTYQYQFPRNGVMIDTNWLTAKNPVFTSSSDDTLEDVFTFVPSSGYEIPDEILYEALVSNPLEYERSHNSDYDKNAVTDITNFPFTTTAEDENERDWSLTWDYVGEYDDVRNEPFIDDSLGGELIVGDLNNDIPILSNLQNRFPFSIPWDIASILKGLQEPRKAPEFHWEIEIPYLEYTWEIDFDLKGFNGVASLFRACFLVSFVIGLALFSYKHHFGT